MVRPNLAASAVSFAALEPFSDNPQIRNFLKSQAWGTIPPLTPSNTAHFADKGRTVIITGANAGLGYEAAKQFVRSGVVSRLILGCQSAQKGETARVQLLEEDGAARVDVQVWALDMASRASISSFVQRANADLERVDAAVLNAGVDLTTYQRVNEEDGGYEMTLMVNVVGTMVMATLMVSVLRRKSMEGREPPRITVVGSGVQFFAKYDVLLQAVTDENEKQILTWLSNPQQWRDKIGPERYYLSKGLMQMCVRQLARDVGAATERGEARVVVNCVNPGYCRTELFRNGLSLAARVGLKLIERDAKVGARALVLGAIGVEGGADSHGGYISEGVVKRCSAWFETDQGEGIGRKLWEEIQYNVERTKSDMQIVI